MTLTALIADLLARHPGYQWNNDGNRIRCRGPECAEIMEADTDTATGLFAGHQGKALAPIVLELEELRSAQADRSGGLAGEDGVVAVPVPDPPRPEIEQPAPEPAAHPGAGTPPERRASGSITSLDWMIEPGDELPVSEKESKRKPKPKPKQWVPPEAAEPVFDEDSRDELAAVRAGDRILARFRNKLHGDFEIEATAVPGLSGETLVAGSWLVTANGGPGLHLRSVTILQTASENTQAHEPSEKPEHIGTAA